MSDFFSELRHGLMEAAERDARTPSLRRAHVPWQPLFAVVGAAAAAVLVLTAAATLSTEAEREIAPSISQPAPGASCEPPPSVLAALRGSFGILRRERTAADGSAGSLRSAELHLYRDEARRMTTLADGAVFLTPAFDCRKGAPAVCISVTLESSPDGGLFCEGVRETLLGGVRYVERANGRRYMVKAVPDHVERFRYSDETTSGDGDVENNLVLADLGPGFGLKQLVLKFQVAGKGGFAEAPTDVHVADTPRERGDGTAERSPQDCGAPPPPAVRGSIPESLTAAFGVLRLPVPENPVPAASMRAAQALLFYEDGIRLARTVGDRELWVHAGEVVSRSTLKLATRDCEPPVESDAAPGLCLSVVKRDGAIGACFLPKEIAAGGAFIDIAKLTAREGTVAGLAPDGAEIAVVEVGGRRTELDIENNAFVGDIDAKPSRAPEARITFR